MSSTPDIFGDIFLPTTLIDASEELLKFWFPRYLTELETRVGLTPGTLVVPSNYSQRNTAVSVPGEDLPKIVILTPGTQGAPTKNGYGVFRATWRLGVGVMVAKNEEDEAYRTASYYGAAIMAIFEHHPSIMGVASDTNLFDIALDDIPTANEHWKFRSAAIQFLVEIDNMVIKYAGPKDPDTGYGVADEVIITSAKL